MFARRFLRLFDWLRVYVLFVRPLRLLRDDVRLWRLS